MELPRQQPPLRWQRVLAMVALFLAATELSVQVGFRVWAGKRYMSMSPYIWSPYGLVRSNPRYSSPRFYHNSQGFRNFKEFSREKPERTLRVMVLGGSTMYSGVGGQVTKELEWVDSGSTVAQYLERRIRGSQEFSDLNIEVINAAVNFNRIVEVSLGYIAEYAHWEPDVVIVGGSANNFGYMLPLGAVAKRSWGILEDHPWRREFERGVNQRSLISLAENTLLTLETYSATVGVLRRGLTQAIDRAFISAEQLSVAFGFEHPSSGYFSPAEWGEFDRYIGEYLGYADAMIAVARRHDQEIAFFWEYLLGNVGDRIPLTNVEQDLYQRNRRPTYKDDAAFDSYARDRVAQHCAERRVVFLDPFERLKTHRETVFIDYLHYTRAGNRIMADFIYEELLEVFRMRAQRIRQGSQAEHGQLSGPHFSSAAKNALPSALPRP